VDTCTYSHRGQKQFQETSHALAFGWHTPGLKVRKQGLADGYIHFDTDRILQDLISIFVYMD